VAALIPRPHLGSRRSRRGYFFTLDGLLAASILLGAFFLFTSYGQIQRPVIDLNFAASDLLSALTTIQFSELNSTASLIIANATTVPNTNQSILGVIGELWASGNVYAAQNLTNFVIESRLPLSYGLGLYFGGDTIYARTSPTPVTQASARTILSGLSKAQPTKGFIASASAETVIRRTTQITSFSAEGAGWDGTSGTPGKTIITKWVNITNTATILNASLAIALHLSDTDPNWTVVNINNGACIYSRNDIAHSGDGYYDIKNVKNCLTTGVNKFTLELRNSGYNAHIHPGMLLQVDYSETTSVPVYTSQYTQRIYFDNVSSIAGSGGSTGAWQLVPFHIPPTATNISVYLQIATRNVTDYTGSTQFTSWTGSSLQEKNYDYVLFFNADAAPFAYNSTPNGTTLYTYAPSKTAPYIVNGTNVIIVYLNNYGDSPWGTKPVSIYSEPFTNPNNSSYVEVNYTLTGALPYGLVEVGVVKQASPPEQATKTINFTFPVNSQMSSVFAHIAQRFSYLITAKADAFNPPSTVVFDSPSSRGVPTDVYVPTKTLSSSAAATNYLQMSDNGGNSVIPNSTVEYRFYLPAFVGFGNVFNTSAAASADAQSRLSAFLGPYIDAGSIAVETSNITNVPTLWGPTLAEVRVWR
jgi:hypothetical protein